MSNLWFQRVAVVTIIAILSFLVWWIIHTYDGKDATLVAVAAFVFNIAFYILGSREHHVNHHTETDRP